MTYTAIYVFIYVHIYLAFLTLTLLRLVRQRLAGGPSELREGPPGLEPAGETAPEGGEGYMSVRPVLSGGGPGNPQFWGGDMRFVGDNVQESVGGTHGVPKAHNRAEGSVTEGRDLASGCSIEVPS